jgi:hypothetical protein
MDCENASIAVAETITACPAPGARLMLDMLTESEKFGVLPETGDEFNAPPQPHADIAAIRSGNEQSRPAFFRHKVLAAFAR